MKIAVTYDSGSIFQHFGHTECFKIYETNGNSVVNAEILNTDGNGHGALASFLKQHGVDTLICGGIGGGAKQALAQAGIQLYGGVSGACDDAVRALLEGSLRFNPSVECSHHSGHHEGGCDSHSHTCGGHCGEK